MNPIKKILGHDVGKNRSKYNNPNSWAYGYDGPEENVDEYVTRVRAGRLKWAADDIADWKANHKNDKDYKEHLEYLEYVLSEYKKRRLF